MSEAAGDVLRRVISEAEEVGGGGGGGGTRNQTAGVAFSAPHQTQPLLPSTTQGMHTSCFPPMMTSGGRQEGVYHQEQQPQPQRSWDRMDVAPAWVEPDTMNQMRDAELGKHQQDHSQSRTMGVDGMPVQVIGNRAHSDELSCTSSVSDTSAAAGGDIQMMEEDDFEDRGADAAANASGGAYTDVTFHGMDSTNDSSSGSMRASSQNSSNDWGYGWYEDVHQPSDQITRAEIEKAAGGPSSSKKQHRHDGTDNRLIPGETASTDGNDMVIPKDSDPSAMAVTAPTYILEESLSSQKLWKYTAGQRPPQPVEERAFYEKMWAQNFARSQVQYNVPVDVLTAASPISLSPFADGNYDVAMDGSEMGGAYDYAPADPARGAGGQAEAALLNRMHHPAVPTAEDGGLVNKKVKGVDSDDDLTILVRGINAFGTTVSKSFARPSRTGGPMAGVDTVNISIASYRVVESKKHGKYAQFLVIYRDGSIHDTVGVWKRYRDFEELARKVTQSHEGCAAVIAHVSPTAAAAAAASAAPTETDVELLPNAITSWRLLKKRQRWYRCLDAGYLSLKVFLLERFLHDILFESSSPKLLREFVGAESALR